MQTSYRFVVQVFGLDVWSERILGKQKKIKSAFISLYHLICLRAIEIKIYIFFTFYCILE